MLGEDETALSQFNARIICEPPNSNLSSFKGMYFLLFLYVHRNLEFNIFPSIAQLVERRTVVEKSDILRSLVRIRFEGYFLANILKIFNTVCNEIERILNS